MKPFTFGKAWDVTVITGAVCWCLGVPAVQAQGTVQGTIHMLERNDKLSKDLSDAVVYLVSESPIANEPSAKSTVTVDMRGREFVPHVQIVAVGGQVAYPNKDPFSHNVFSNSAQGAFDLGLYRTGASRAAVFATPGVYAIYCNIHARMVNFVLALNTPFATRVHKSGSFRIPNVPPGVYRMHVWHERSTEIVQTVTVTNASTYTVSVSLDARGFVASAHTDKFGKPYASTRADRY